MCVPRAIYAGFILIITEVQVDFVQTVRLTETMLGINGGTSNVVSTSVLDALKDVSGSTLFSATVNQTAALESFANTAKQSHSVAASQAVMNAIPILLRMEKQLDLNDMIVLGNGRGPPLMTRYGVWRNNSSHTSHGI
jgi:hypothetical protein